MNLNCVENGSQQLKFVGYSTVTDFAKLRGLSTSKPRNTPM
jgi:hypothetical protein